MKGERTSRPRARGRARSRARRGTSRPARSRSRSNPPLARGPPALLGRCLRLGQDHGDQRHRGDADRAVDQEAPAPGQIVREPPAERRPDHRRHHHRDAEQREALAALLRREGVRQDRLSDRHHAAAAETLQDAEEQQRIQVPGMRAHHRAHGEQRQADQEERLAAEAAREEAAGRQGDGVGDQIGRHHPGRLVLADPHAAGDIGQHHVGDGGVEHLHEGRERDQDRDQPRIGFGRRGGRGARYAGAQSLALSRA